MATPTRRETGNASESYTKAKIPKGEEEKRVAAGRGFLPGQLNLSFKLHPSNRLNLCSLQSCNMKALALSSS